MFKHLTTTTAALAFVTALYAGSEARASMAAPTAATPGMPELKIEGDLKAVIVTYDQTKANEVRSGQGQGYAFLTTGGIDFKADGKLPQNDAVEYSMVIGLTGDTNPGNVGSSASVRKAYLEVSSPFGSMIAGNNESVLDMISTGAANVLGGEGGWNGTFADMVTTPSGIVLGDSITSDPGTATTIILSTPDNALKGFKLMAGITPNTSQYGFASPTDSKNQNGNNNFRYMFGDPTGTYLNGGVVSKKNMFDMTNADPSNGAYDLNSVTAGLAYSWGNPSEASFGFSVAGVMGKSKWNGNDKAYNPSEDPNADILRTAVAGTNAAAGAAHTSKLNDTKAYQVGFNVGYRNFEFGATYTDNRESRVAKRWKQDDGHTGKYDAGKIMSAAMAYTRDAIKISGGASQGKRKFNGQETKSTVYTVALDYTMTPGWKFSAEYDYATLKTCDRAKEIAASTYGSAAIADNTPKVFMVSTSINF